MYVPPHFQENRPDELHRLIREHSLGILVTGHAGVLDANHLPFELELSGEKPLLRAHVARSNPVWRESDGEEVLVIFRGEHAYVSPNWYPSKHEAHRQVPTWNYQVVHVRGRLKVMDEERFVRGVVGRLTRTHEASEDKPWKMSDSTPEFISGMLENIVGIEVEISEIVGKSKLSQNKEDRDRLGAAERLEQLGSAELAGAMKAAGE
ncbi:FMN-binding negative transcriptional regulator [Pseudomonas sp. ZM23]|uniref:FMN-binding negative transcriptional regulator n=1 Tax=Pseudomonas triclosanedens TaxID=2961893 RepID=A0ABY6ZUA4_9PSED|nr:FMN-binding negative transcriptional regulator [Pseudomonas triclosanedens]MCP8467083.1 FMN-binding negative transcriptional regulator [Pseudomonas triclosanedens]MCP8472768.1 FMN-binding negative transcriptional regulator [Pseudomonas triclosanedens]MCP8478199.1 FMN-binding negative transcriptional regulator [Pseudomonas triclosanedens]WAI47605.1 FMN-binding negative transcriptional regulator [Pseudomonas triclosanedens]